MKTIIDIVLVFGIVMLGFLIANKPIPEDYKQEVDVPEEMAKKPIMFKETIYGFPIVESKKKQNKPLAGHIEVKVEETIFRDSDFNWN